MGVIAYFLYGAKGEYQKTYQMELTLSVLSLALKLKQTHAPIKIAFISDQQNSRPDLPVDPIIISSGEIGEWTRHGRFYHGAKIHALARALDVYKQPTILIDSDTVFRGDPSALFDRISPGHSLLHEAEYALADAKHFAGFLAQVASRDIPGPAITGDTVIYNSGVVGLDPSDAPLLSRADALVDQILSIEPTLFLAEQLSTSVVLSQATKISECKDIVEHYYGFRRHFVHARLRGAFPQATRESFDAALRSGDLPSTDYPPKPLLDRLIAKLRFGLRRDVYPFIYLAYRCAFSARSNPEYANAWLAVALDAIQYDPDLRRSGAQMRRDLHRLSDWETLEWLDPETRARAGALWSRLTRSDGFPVAASDR